MQLIVAEKPSVARDLARVLGVRASGKHAFEGAGRVITWCIGHLVELEEPAAYDPRWKAWREETLPMVPAEFKLRASAATRDQLRAVKELLKDKRFNEVVNACDAGREGELIFRYLHQYAHCRLPIRRLWISSLTDEAIRAGFASLQPGARFEPLADAARSRSEADWLVGLNATRAVTLRGRRGADSTLYSIGRVQTPTLAMLVAREKAIAAFVPKDYWEVKGTFQTIDGATAQFAASFNDGRAGAARLATAALANELVARDSIHARATDPEGPRVERLQTKSVREPPPLLFDLTSLQRTANKRYGLSAARTLEIAQALYERHKLLTYPRTDSRHLPMDIASELPERFAALASIGDYAPFAKPLLLRAPSLPKRVFDDSKVRDHHAIVPTAVAAPERLERLDRDERRIFDLVARRFLGAFHGDAEFAVTDVTVRVGAGSPAPLSHKGETREEPIAELPPPPDRYVARGRVRLAAGWQAVAGIEGTKSGDERRERDEGEGEPLPSLPPLAEGQRLDGAFEPLAKRTAPPRPHTEATLLAAMETAGREIDDEALRQAMKERGLGTPATRAAILETLLKRGYARRDGKQLRPTPLGTALIEALVPATAREEPVAGRPGSAVESLASPELTGAWEARLSRIARGEERRADFMADIARYVHEVVDAIRAAPAPAPTMATQPINALSPPRNRGRAPKGSRARGTPSDEQPTPRSQRKPRKQRGSLTPGELVCPRCRLGTLITGKRGWGCSRWREGCGFVVWFETGGRRVSESQLRELVTRGKTRRTTWDEHGARATGRLVLDPTAESGAARWIRESS